jgi:hypothetical protein
MKRLVFLFSPSLYRRSPMQSKTILILQKARNKRALYQSLRQAMRMLLIVIFWSKTMPPENISTRRSMVAPFPQQKWPRSPIF